MQNIVRTEWGSVLQTALLIGTPVSILPSSTLNEKLNIQPNTAIGANQYPRMRYAAIGSGGHKFVMAANNIAKPEVVQHTATDAALYKQIPFVLRAINDDLSPLEREKYALRRIEDHDGAPYIAYYLKRLDYTNVTVQMDYKTVSDGVTTTTPFIPNNSNLNPIPPDLTNTGVNVTTGDYVTATAKIPFSLSESEVTELLNVATIIYGDEGLAIISEIALCSGVDKIVSADLGGGAGFNFNEVIGCQVVSFISGFFAMQWNNTGVDMSIDLGATEPLGLPVAP